MPSVIDLYEKLASATDDKARAKIIAEAFEALEERYPNLSDTVTRTDLSETELRLIKEIEQVRADLTKEIEQVRAELKGDIERVRAELKVDLANTRANILVWSFVFWLTQFSAILILIWRVWPEK
ncbi:MAG: hypothetical protein JXR29_10245 [Methylothermaceae bacterium]|nr:hypothetical protein [Methylothermaceae bacterium]